MGSISYLEVKKHLGINYLVTKNVSLDEVQFDTNVVNIQKREIINSIDNKAHNVFLLY